ncbi:Cold-shock protein [Trypanosoma melophagium]|uniref:Cold-shock protein n=1 Tax=Trypanosoma melophagium TaxID=715481 RepID=UPI00351A35CE|nr:Cold-shock protein [Trypanosoma melophagium]
MFRLSGWRLAALVSSPPLFQKSKTSSELTDALSSQTATRRVGTVVSFMHRRGYGFLRETELSTVEKGLKASATSTAGTPPTNSISNKGTESTGDNAGCSFFFPRASLDGGFYLTEGQTVSFDVRDVNPSQKLKVHLAAEESSVATTTTTTVENENDSPKSLSVAHRIRLYDTTTGKEKPVTPITLYGFVENWDSLAGTGVIAELDLSGSLHDDAPRFTVSLEDLDLAGRSELRRGRYVRFCLEPGDRTAARRVIIDRSAEQKHGVHRVGNTAENGDKNEKRHYGTVREVVEGRFGFVVLDETGESIFFHMSNAEGSVKPGDTVSFLLFEMTQGKHVGKKACMGVRRCMVKPSSSTNTTAGAGKNKNSSKKSKAAEEWDDDEFELLD